MQARPVGRRTRGGSKKTCIEGSKKKKNGTVVTELRKIAGDRKYWGRLTEAPDEIRHKGWRKKKIDYFHVRAIPLFQSRYLLKRWIYPVTLLSGGN